MAEEQISKGDKKSGITPLLESAAKSFEIKLNFFITLQMTCTEKILGSPPETSLMLASFTKGLMCAPGVLEAHHFLVLNPSIIKLCFSLCIEKYLGFLG